MRRRLKVKQEGERRNIFLRYLGEVADGRRATSTATDKKTLYDQLLAVAKRKTAEADMKLDERGKAIDEEAEEDFGDNVLIVEPANDLAAGRCTPQTGAAGRERNRARSGSEETRNRRKRSSLDHDQTLRQAAPLAQNTPTAKPRSTRTIATRRPWAIWSAWPIGSSTTRRRSAIRISTSRPARSRT